MQKRTSVIIIILFLMTVGFITNSNAQSEKNKFQSWYTLWAVGWVNAAYPPAIDEQIDIIKRQPGYSHQLVAFDVLGFYKPAIDDQTAFGGIVNGVYDRHSVDNQDISIGDFQLSASALRFVQDRIGKGFFLRLDLGITHAFTDGSERDRSTDWGLGALVGAGFGLPISSRIRILLTGAYSSRWYSWNDPNQYWQVTIGALL